MVLAGIIICIPGLLALWFGIHGHRRSVLVFGALTVATAGLLLVTSCSNPKQTSKAFDSISRAADELNLISIGRIAFDSSGGKAGFSQQRPWRDVAVLVSTSRPCEFAHEFASRLETLGYAPNAVSCQDGAVSIGSQRRDENGTLVSLTIDVHNPGERTNVDNTPIRPTPAQAVVVVEIAAGG